LVEITAVRNTQKKKGNTSMTKQEVKKLAWRGLLLFIVGTAITAPGQIYNIPFLAVIGWLIAVTGIIMLIVAGLNHTL